MVRYHRGDEPIPGFRLVSFLGKGNFGEVWKATAPGDTLVAIKFIDLDGQKGLKEFRSLRLVKRIRHPNLVPIMAYWFLDEEGRVLESAADTERLLIESSPSAADLKKTLTWRPPDAGSRPTELIIVFGLGDQSLTDRLQHCREAGLPGIPPDELLDYLDGAAQAIDYLSRSGLQSESGAAAIQHCDIKPQNILIVGGAAQVCDFGVARAVDDTRATSIGATPAYGAPELLSGGVPSAATDQYSLAITYVELRTGSLPFDTDRMMSVINAHLRGQLNLSRLSGPERAVIKRATALDPAKRFPSCRHMVAALRDAYQTSQRKGSSPRRRLLVAGLSLLALAILAGGGYLGLTRFEPTPVPAAWLPETFEPLDGAVLVEAQGAYYYDRIVRTFPRGAPVVFILIPNNDQHPYGPDTFYIMEDMVWNGLFRMFDPLGPEDVQEQLPAMGMDVETADRFARWLVGPYGRLPSVEQWNKAAGTYYHQMHPDRGREGPFLPDWDPSDPYQIGLDRDQPLPVGTASHDVSHPFRCRDMAGNGLEWTRDLSHDERTIPLSADPGPFATVILRSRSYRWPRPQPLTYADLQPAAPAEAGPYHEGQPDIGFRVVIEPPDSP